jgi:conjugal transfer pilin signal peptidase TrbI
MTQLTQETLSPNAAEAVDAYEARQWQLARNLRKYLLLVTLIAIPFSMASTWIIKSYIVAGNSTSSLPDAFFIVERDRNFKPKRGDLFAFRVGQGVRHYPVGLIFIKRVVGVSGDKIEWQGNKVFVAGKYVGEGKVKNSFNEPLEWTKSEIIPAGMYFAATESPQSYDSRYTDIGLINQSQIVGSIAW